LSDGAGIFLTETVTGIGVGVGVGTGVTVAVTVGELVAVLVAVDTSDGVGVWIEGGVVARPCNVRPQAESKERITR